MLMCVDVCVENEKMREHLAMNVSVPTNKVSVFVIASKLNRHGCALQVRMLDDVDLEKAEYMYNNVTNLPWKNA